MSKTTSRSFYLGVSIFNLIWAYSEFILGQPGHAFGFALASLIFIITRRYCL